MNKFHLFGNIYGEFKKNKYIYSISICTEQQKWEDEDEEEADVVHVKHEEEVEDIVDRR